MPAVVCRQPRPKPRPRRSFWRRRSGLRKPPGILREARARFCTNPSQLVTLLLGGSRQDLYAFTHSLIYVTDLNIRPWRLPRQRNMILADAEAALARCLDDQDYDLAGELLLAWPLTGRSWGASAAFGFRVLAHVEDRAGFLPSTSTRLERANLLQGDDRAKYLLATAYHTAYVMGLLCAVTLQPHRAPPKAIKGTNASPGVSQMFLDKLDKDPQRPHWREEFDQLSQPERQRPSAR